MRISDWSSDVCSSDLYADLGFTDAEEMLVKAQLVTKIGDIIKQRKLTQQQAAELMGMSQGRVSNMLRGPFHGISETKRLCRLTRLGRDVQFVVGQHPRRDFDQNKVVRGDRGTDSDGIAVRCS